MKKLSSREIMNRELDILKYINEFCKENNITYFLAYGTLIGAIRHKGFIPWDDDIDIVMKRSDYERFITSFNDDSDRFSILNIDTEEDYYYPFTKIVDTETIVIEKDFKPIKNMGVWVDVFPLDNYSASGIDEKDVEICKKKLLLSRSVRYVKAKNFTKSVLKFLGYILYKNKNPQLYGRYLNELGKASKEETGSLCVLFIPKLRKNIFDSEWYKNAIYHEFEGELFLIPEHYHEILTIYYGDYMELPSIENRNSGHNVDAYIRR